MVDYNNMTSILSNIILNEKLWNDPKFFRELIYTTFNKKNFIFIYVTIFYL